jgi:predicted DNA-binding transcriptional regulator AlpA
MTNIVQLNFEDLQIAIKDCLRDAIDEIKSIPEPAPLPDRIDRGIVKQMTGKSDQWVYQKTTKNAKDPLPFQKFGRELVFSRKEIQEYIDSHTKVIPSSDKIMSDQLQKSANKKLK